MTKQRERKRVFNSTHIVKTIRIAKDYADFLNRMDTGERAMFVSKALRQRLDNKSQHSFRKPKKLCNRTRSMK